MPPEDNTGYAGEKTGREDARNGRRQRTVFSSCPMCPAKFYKRDPNLLEEHMRLNHSTGINVCPVCSKRCTSIEDLMDHLSLDHFKVEANVPKTRASKAAAKPSKAKEKVSAKKTKPKNDVRDMGSDTDEDYMTKENVVIKIKKSKQVVVPKKSKNKKANSQSMKKLARKDAISENKSEDKEEADVKDMIPKRAMEDKSFKSATGEVKCIECGKEYKSRRALRRHFSVAHEEKEHICEICGHSFKGKESLYHHKRGVHDNLKVYKCTEPGCGQSFNFSHSLRLHKLKHSGLRPHMCNVCGKTYLTAYHLKVHMQATHSEKKNFACKICNKLFSYTTSLKMHEATHDKVERVKCESCDKTFVNQQALKYHIMSKHSEPGHFPCKDCGKVYKTEFLLRNHRKRHSVDSTRFMCDICGRQFMYKSALEMHKAIHRDEKSYVCKICNKSFKTYPTLYSHQYVHREDSPFTCSTCGKSFKTKERLKAHEKRHSGLKPFKCMICNHCFPDNGGLSKHMRTVHCKVKKFVCDVCGKATSRADNLRVHMKVHMKDSNYKPKQPRDHTREAKGTKQAAYNLPSVVANSFEEDIKNIDEHSEDTSSNSGGHFASSGYEPNMPHYSTVDPSQIVSSSAQTMPLNLHHTPGSSSQASVPLPAFVAQQGDQGDAGNRANPGPPPVSSSGGLVTLPALQPAGYLYTWPYPYPPGIQPQSSNSSAFFQQQ